jgi:hypothetical protein
MSKIIGKIGNRLDAVRLQTLDNRLWWPTVDFVATENWPLSGSDDGDWDKTVSDGYEPSSGEIVLLANQTAPWERRLAMFNREGGDWSVDFDVSSQRPGDAQFRDRVCDAAYVEGKIGYIRNGKKHGGCFFHVVSVTSSSRWDDELEVMVPVFVVQFALQSRANIARMQSVGFTTNNSKTSYVIPVYGDAWPDVSYQNVQVIEESSGEVVLTGVRCEQNGVRITMDPPRPDGEKYIVSCVEVPTPSEYPTL